ncbi:hypothetical protein E4T48_00762 [Aureobasidium sp. EXF-10727]|nr:hypothetical protein E4T48_00762 [Aureobasidium sp. EXF-10727]KAI4732074.1 hypothetical protein E4T49_00053 [Aureobasidium sp. EXF-10728]
MDPATIAANGKSSLSLKAAAIAFIPITVLALSLRLYVRCFIVKGFGIDDMFLIGAQVSLIDTSIVLQLITLEHDPTILADISGSIATAVPAIEKIYMSSVLFTLFYVFSLIFLKLSLAFFYLRIIVQQWQKVVIYVTVMVMSMYGFAYAFTYMFRCGADVNHQILLRAQGRCIPDHTLLIMTYIFGSIDTSTDFIYAFLPIYVLWNSNMPVGMKFTAGFLLCMGSVSSVCALVRVATLSNLTTVDGFFKQAVETGLWSVIEPGLAIVATSIAACRPLWRKFFEDTSTGSFIKNHFMVKWSGSRKSGASSDSSGSTDKPVTIGRAPGRANGFGFVERSEGNKGFKKFNDDEYGISLATVAVGDDGDPTEMQDLGRLEAQTEYLEDDDENDRRSLVRTSMPPPQSRSNNGGERTDHLRNSWHVATAPLSSIHARPQNPNSTRSHTRTTMLATRLSRSCAARCSHAHRAFSTTSLLSRADNPIPANDTKDRSTPSPVSSTNAMPLSSEGNMDKPLQESVAEGEERRVMQAPNRAAVWSRSQQPREKAMVGPRFEQMIMYDQPRPMAAIELIHKQPVNWVKERTVKCDGGGGPLGHPRIFINVDRPQICWCTYCGLPYAKESNRKMLESLPSTSYPLEPQGHEAEVPQGYQSNTGKPLEQR